MVAKDPHPSITLCDSRGEVVARHDPRPEQDASEYPGPGRTPKRPLLKTFACGRWNRKEIQRQHRAKTETAPEL